MINKVNGLLGLSAKSGNILAGTDLVLDEMFKKRVKLVILASDASEKTKKNMKYYCDKANVEIVIYGTIEENSKAIGKKNKAVLAIKDRSLADAIKKVIHGGEAFGKN